MPVRQARPREPKTATVERREASVPRHGTVLLHTPPYRSSLTVNKFPFRLDFSAFRAILRHAAPGEISDAECCRYAVGEPMTKRLTEIAVQRAHAPKTGQIFLWDGEVRGFGVRILPGGSKTFWFQYRPRGGGSSRMIRIETFPKISVANARKEAQVFAGEVARGGDPAAKRQAERMRDKATLRVLLAEDGPYQVELRRRGVVNSKKALSSLRRELAGLMSREVTYLTRRDLVAAIDVVENGGRPGAAEDLRKFSRVFLEWCVGAGLLAANPLAGHRRPVRTRAERLKAAGNGGRALSDDEIRNVWQAAGDKSFGSFGALA